MSVTKKLIKHHSRLLTTIMVDQISYSIGDSVRVPAVHAFNTFWAEQKNVDDVVDASEQLRLMEQTFYVVSTAVKDFISKNQKDES